MATILDDLEAHIETFPNKFWDMDEGTNTFNMPPVGSRQILTVQTAVCMSGNYKLNDTDPTPRANSVLRLLGQPAPSSEAERGHIFFTTEAELKVPRYVAADKRIDLWMRDEMLPMVMQQLTHANRYLWIGWFANGHIYGDLHSV